jgi:adenylate kinase family enzyme
VLDGACFSGPRRIHIIGGPGSGKTTLARRLGAQLHLPVYDLDKIAFDGKAYVERPLEVRLGEVHAIATQAGWITEGIFLGWVDELLATADVIVWLDGLPWHTAMWRIVTRFVQGGWLEVRRQRGLDRFMRFRDYARNTQQLVGVMFSSREYYHSAATNVADEARRVTRAATASQLHPYRAKVIHCTNRDEVQAFVATLVMSGAQV